MSCRLNDAQSRVQSAEEREQTLSVKLRQLEEDLQNQAELSRVNLIQAGKDAQAKADVQVEKAKQEADDEAERVRLEHEEQCKALRVQIQVRYIIPVSLQSILNWVFGISYVTALLAGTDLYPQLHACIKHGQSVLDPEYYLCCYCQCLFSQLCSSKAQKPNAIDPNSLTLQINAL